MWDWRGLTADQPNRNRFNRLRPAQISDHSPLTLSNPHSRNRRKPRPCLIWPNTSPPFPFAGHNACVPDVLQLAAHPVPGRKMAGYPPTGHRRWHCAVVGPLRRNEGVHSQGCEFLCRPCRVVLSVGRNLPGHRAGVVYVLLHHHHGLLLVRRLVGGPRRHNHLMLKVRHRLAENCRCSGSGGCRRRRTRPTPTRQ